MNKTLLLIVILVLGAWAGFSLKNQLGNLNPSPEPIVTYAPSPTPIPVDIKATFLIFTHGTKRDFSAKRYHNLSKVVFITPENPNLVSVKSAQVTWGDFFNTLPMELSSACLVTGDKQTFCTGGNRSLKFYLNGKKTDDFLNLEIKHNDQALISYGLINDPQIQKQLTQIPKVPIPTP